jgi:hypothetical protein
MKKRIIFASLIGLLVLGTSCEDNRDEYLSDYDTRMYFRNSDLQEQDCYVTGETTAYTVSVVKAGSDLGAVSDASVSLMEAAQLQIYNEDNVTNYSVLPSNCYTLNGELNMSFASGDSYQAFDVVFDPEAVHNLPTANYVVPFVLSSSKTVNENKNVLFVKPNAIVPTIYFEKSGFSATSLSKNGPDQVELDLPVIIPMANKWDFNCTIEVDQALLDTYNAEHGTDYQLLPAAAYTLNKDFKFEMGTTVTKSNITLDKTQLDMGEYVLPLRLANCTQPYFQIDKEKSTCLFSVIYVPGEIPLKLDMLSSNATVEGDGTGLAGLFDGLGGAKHWHSNYSGSVIDPVYGHYIDFALPNAIQYFAFDFWTRYENANGAPATVTLYTSNDGATWTKWVNINMSLTSGNEEYNSSVFKSEETFKYLRFSVTESNAGNVTNGSYWNCGEMKIYGE